MADYFVIDADSHVEELEDAWNFLREIPRAQAVADHSAEPCNSSESECVLVDRRHRLSGDFRIES